MSLRQDTSAVHTRRRPPRRGRLAAILRRLLWGTVGLAALVLIAPWFIAVTPFRHSLLHFVRPDLPVQPTVAVASLGWFSPIRLRGVTIPDLDGGPLLALREVRIERPLWEVLMDPDDVGRISLFGPDVTIVLRPDGSNLGDLLQRLQPRPAEPSRAVWIEWVAGDVRVVRPSGEALEHFVDVEGVYRKPVGDAAHHSLLVSVGSEAPFENGRLRFAAEGRLQPDSSRMLPPGAFELQLERWPIDHWLPLLREPLRADALVGHVSLEVEASWNSLNEREGRARCSAVVSSLRGLRRPRGSPGVVERFNLSGRLDLSGDYDRDADRWTLEDSRIDTPWGSGRLAGSVTDWAGRRELSLTIDLASDIVAWLDQFWPAVRESMRVEGLRLEQIALRGPLRAAASGGSPTPPSSELSPRLLAEAQLAWDLVEAAGVESRDAEVGVGYDGERIVAVPTRVPVSGGRLVSLPQIVLGGNAPTIVVSDGPMLEDVEFSEDLCRGWMRFVSPLMAHATSVSGSFSVGLHAGAFPLHALPDAGLGGTLVIHQARVGPGPLTRQILGIVQNLRGVAGRPGEAVLESLQWLTVTEQQVDFRLEAGRVHHARLSMFAGPVLPRSASRW